MKKAIVHISDLHVTLHEDLKGNPAKSINSWLTTKPDDKHSEDYINDFCNYIKKYYEGYCLFLLISGDIANVSDPTEYDYAIKYLETIKAELKISEDKILLVPGDHDIHRRSCEDAYRTGKLIDPYKKSYEYNEEKYRNFSTFYQSITKKKFEYNSSLIDLLDFKDEKLLIIGLNSNYCIDYESGGLGSIDAESLKKELKAIEPKFGDYSKIAMFHHNISSSFDDSSKGQWEKENRVTVMAILETYNYKCLLYGNEHTRNSSVLGSDKQLYKSDCGSFSMKNPPSSFKIYELEQTPNRFVLKLKLFVLQNSNKNDEHKAGVWGIQNNQDLNEIEEVILFETQSFPIVVNNDLDAIYNNIEIENNVVKEPKILLEVYSNNYYKDKLFDIVKRKKLFHSGHFHWSATSRAHNWIDVSKVLNDRDDLFLAKNAIIDVIESCNLKNKFDFILGLGIEGNILATRASVKYNKPYSYLPYSYRYDEHNEYEKQLNFENKNEFKSVLIITDVVNDGRTIRKLIHKKGRATEFFKPVEKILVISLFYTGDSVEKSTSILNTVKDRFDSDNDHFEERIEYYFVKDMKVEKCPYKENFRTECLIVKEKLGCVHSFYDDEKAVKKLESGK